MKEIQPVTMWNGVEGIYLNAWGVNVTLNTSAVFSYNILRATRLPQEDKEDELRLAG